MSTEAETIAALKTQILEDPRMILEDRDMMQALLRADSAADDRNIVDLRGRLVERLENRLDQLEDTHRTVIAAAYENLAGTNQIHRAILAVLEPMEFGAFLTALGEEVANILSVDVIRLALESTAATPGQALGPSGPQEDLVIAFPKGGVDLYIAQNRDVTPRKVALRQCDNDANRLYGAENNWVLSEAVIKLDLGDGNLPGLLAFGSQDADRFHPEQGIDLLTFYGSVFERMMRRWLA